MLWLAAIKANQAWGIARGWWPVLQYSAGGSAGGTLKDSQESAL